MGGAETGVGSATEGDMWIGSAGDVEGIRIFKHLWIPVGRGEVE